MSITDSKKRLFFGAAMAVIFTGGILFSSGNLPGGFVQALSLQPPDPNVYGWAWSSNIGWLSFNCDQPEIGRDICPQSFYGVKADLSSGDMAGFGWSETLGWIRFDPAGPYPGGGPNYSAKIDLASGELSGWARVCSAMESADCNDPGGGGEQEWGWIKLRGPSYGASFNGTTAEFEGWAFGGPASPSGDTASAYSAAIGWLSFNCLDRGVCGSSDYKVYLLAPPLDFEFVPDFLDWQKDPALVTVRSLSGLLDAISYCWTNGLSCEPGTTPQSCEQGSLAANDCAFSQPLTGAWTLCVRGKNTTGWTPGPDPVCSSANAYKVDATSPALNIIEL